jgi:cellobiose phosphorylase
VGLSPRVQAGMDPCAAMQVILWLAPGETKEVTFLLGQGADRQQALDLIEQYQDIKQVNLAWQELGEFWGSILGAVKVKSPDLALDILFNRWLLYQVLSCRVWGRTAAYQSSGAFGFRDQLQDVLAAQHARPTVTRQMILEASAHQFREGDVLHWWHPPVPHGVRTRCSDDLLWLPFVVAGYVHATGDTSLLDEQVAFLEGPLLEDGHLERYDLYRVSQESGTVYEHCLRALDYSLAVGKTGVHGLPLIGSGDWNDGMNLVGAEGRGESVWMGWFIIATLEKFRPIMELKGDGGRYTRYGYRLDTIKNGLANHAWDGAWYRRAFFDDGTPLGSHENDACQIDAIAQSWAVISGAAPTERALQAMDSAASRLVRSEDMLIALFDPPFDQTRLDPGYVKGYLPGIRENGGQYTHGIIWTLWAFAEMGQGDRLGDLLHLINPVYHSDTNKKANHFRLEPYVIPADVYSQPPYTGRGGWSWYTGSAGWMYRLCLEMVFGIRRSGETLEFNPCIPHDWDGFSLEYRDGDTLYQIQVRNPNGVQQGVSEVWFDGVIMPDKRIRLANDGTNHIVEVIMGDMNSNS